MPNPTAGCAFVLAYFTEYPAPDWQVGLVDDTEVVIGAEVDGPGRLHLPGVAATHAIVSRERNGIWLRSEPNAKTWLNGLPLFAGPVSLVKGDRIRLGVPHWQNELVTTCTVELAERNRSCWSRCGFLMDAGVEELSPAEYEVFAWMGRGVTELEDVAVRLCRSVNTVRTQLGRVYEKLSVHSKPELLGFLLRYRIESENRVSPAGDGQGTCECFR